MTINCGSELTKNICPNFCSYLMKNDKKEFFFANNIALIA